MPTCHECQNITEEDEGRWVILGKHKDGFDWMFLCIKCVRSWRQRGLERQNHLPSTIKDILDKEYPLT